MPITPMVSKLRSYIRLTDAEVAHLRELTETARSVRANIDLISEGERQGAAYILLDGWSCCYRHVGNGRRQITNFALPGDFIGMRSILFRAPHHSFATLSPCLVSEIGAGRLRELFELRPRIGMAFLWAMARDEAIIEEHLVKLRRYTPVERAAHMILELLYRMRLVGLAHGNRFRSALSAEILANALGLKPAHVELVVSRLEHEGIVSVGDDEVVIHSLPRLSALCDYDGRYLEHIPVGL